MDRPLRVRGGEVGAIGRRPFDVAAALMGLIVLAPVMLVIACAIRLDTPGPVLFSQDRVGRGGQHFRLYKFRKFGHRTDGGGSLTPKHDARMKSVGRLLDRTKLA